MLIQLGELRQKQRSGRGAELEDIAVFQNHLDIAVDAFAREAEKMRDVEAEGRAVKDAKAKTEASAASRGR